MNINGVRLQRQRQRNECHYRMSEPLLSYFVAVTVSLGRPYTRFAPSLESNASEKSQNESVVLRFFARIPSKIWRSSEVVNRFLRNPFSFFVRIFSTSDQIRLRIIALQTLATISVRAMPLSWFRGNPFYGSGICILHSFLYSDYIYISLKKHKYCF